VEDAAGFVLQACEAVGEAHASKIIHRDLKPQNLFLTTGLDGEPLVKVLDFGISKSLTPTSGDGGAPMTLTRTHSMLGSPLYMSPEQMRSSKRADERSDIWSFGVILFELLTGRVPFEADNVPELVFKMAENEAPSVLTLRPDVPPALAAAVQRCLQKEPDKRFATLADLAMELEPFASPRERGIAARIGVMLGTMQPRARAMSFSDVSGAKSAPAIAVSDAWGATQSADASAPAAKGKAAASGALRIALGAVVVVGLGVFAFAFTRSRMTHDQVDHAAAAGTGVPAQSTGVPAQASGAAPLASPSALASTTLPAPSAVAVPSASASALTPSAQGAPLSPRPGARAGKVGTGAPGGGAPSAAAPSVAPSPSARGGFIQVRE
jgi:serine/threonine-protein kinase